MAKLRSMVVLQLLFGTFRLCLFQTTSSDLRSVHPGENITLHCDITADYEISWYHQSAEEMKLLVSAGKDKLNKSFSLNHNVDEDHYEGTENSSSVSLVIIGVNETDLGQYYCGGRGQKSLLQFGKAIRLTFADAENYEEKTEDAECPPDSPDPKSYQILIAVLMSVCLVSVLINIILLWLLCYRAQGMPNICWRDTSSTHSLEKVSQELEMQYASPVYNRDLREATEENTAPASDNVTYAKVSWPTPQSATNIRHLPA
ncbi:uncharacterized protein LOC118802862 [Colossoma macropomum]|uniref:uncharacterized protein LOC118802862 n=1 Tax=Colossoma macropomum TaxID=42526 RepID=UPI001864D455|nr:uncharacterized protein LOC118802862 [Colossoma macropomum]